ncbi:hypothetical protein ACWD4L_44205, partial [Streptomyces sp. NPDC002596]
PFPPPQTHRQDSLPHTTTHFSSANRQQLTTLVVEPGGFATDWAGSSTHTPDVTPEYDATVGEMARLFSGGATAQGDPKRAGEILVRVVKHPIPPTHLIIGAGAVQMAQDYSRSQLEEAATWEAVTRFAETHPADDAEAVAQLVQVLSALATTSEVPAP